MAAEYIPKVKLDAEIETYELFEKRLMSIQVDSTQRVGNWFGFVFRCIDDNLNIVMRPKLVRIEGHIQEAKEAEELSDLVVYVVNEMVDFYQRRDAAGGHNRNVLVYDADARNRLVAISGDRISINRCAFMGRHIYHKFRNVIFLDCHPHTLANCCKHMDDGCLYQSSFWAVHNAVFARSEDARLAWCNFQGHEMVDHNNTRWFGKRDSKCYVRSVWDEYVKFFRRYNDDEVKKDSSVYKMRNILLEEKWDQNNMEAYQTSRDRKFLIRLELAIVCIASTEYYRACYNLEGKINILALHCTKGI